MYGESRKMVQMSLFVWWEQRCFPGGSAGKESACNARDPNSIPALGRSPGKGMTAYSSILGWRIPWTEEPGGLHGVGKSQT